jgi:hypothetical protein
MMTAGPICVAVPRWGCDAYDASRGREDDVRVVRWIVAGIALGLLAGFVGGFAGALLHPRSPSEGG